MFRCGTGGRSAPLDVRWKPCRWTSKEGAARQAQGSVSTDGKPLSFMPEQVEVSVTIEEEEASRRFQRLSLRAKDFRGVYTESAGGDRAPCAGAKSIIDKLELTGGAGLLRSQWLAGGRAFCCRYRLNCRRILDTGAKTGASSRCGSQIWKLTIVSERSRPSMQQPQVKNDNHINAGFLAPMACAVWPTKNR